MAEAESKLLVCDSFSHDSEGNEVTSSSVVVCVGPLVRTHYACLAGNTAEARSDKVSLPSERARAEGHS